MAQIQHLTTATGVTAVGQAVAASEVSPSTDGLTFAAPDSGTWFADGITMSARLVEFFTDIRLLRRIPLSYLVPDADLLPPESIRFFHVDQTWVDRVIDGAVSNTNLGTVDFHRSLIVLHAIRETLPVLAQTSGMLIRSELVRRWPKMGVRAYTSVNAAPDADSDVEVLRAEPISRDVYIALFAGEPQCVHLREPFDGVRYGVEFDEATNTNTVDRRNPDGTPGSGKLTVTFRNPQQRRTLNIKALSDTVGDAREVALHLEQRPYVQMFTQPTLEAQGSKEPPPQGLVPLRNGRTFKLQFAPQALFKAD